MKSLIKSSLNNLYSIEMNDLKDFRVGRFGRMALKHVNIMYEMSCQSRFDARYWILGAGALGRPRGMEWGGWREEGSGWGTHVYLWRIHFDIWQI